MATLTQPALQQRTLHFYGELTALAPYWAGKLLLGLGEGCSSSGFPAACSLAGGASLLLESSMADAKAALRDGGVDFLVSTVDEALRTLKNELRKARPLAVALLCDNRAASEELQERGVLPNLLFFSGERQPPEGFAAGWRRVPTLSRTATAGFAPVHEARESFGDTGRLRTYTWSLPNRAALQALDATLLGVLTDQDTVRRRWLAGITRYQRSAERDYRVFWLTPEEEERVAAMHGTKEVMQAAP